MDLPGDLRTSLEGFGIQAPVCRRVLLVDDEPDNLVVLSTLLEDDWEVHTAEGGRQALEVIDRSGEMDLVIADQRMPGMKGVDLLVEIAGIYPETVRMVLTAYTDVEPIVDAINRGSVYRFLLKPWNPAEVRAAVADALDMKATRTALSLVLEALEERNESLKRTLAELERAQEQLLRAERLTSLGRFTSGITHNINNQLTVMLRLVEKLRSCGDEHLQETAGNALRTLESMVGMVRDVNHFARSRSLELKFASIDVNGFLEETVKFFRLESVGTGRSISSSVSGTLTQLRIDPHRLRQALLALIRNGAQASPTGEPLEVAVRTDGASLVIEVVDRGVGMDPPTLARAREPFFSAFEPRGLGLGLEIARLVIEGHGGALELESAPGRGTTARLRLPIVEPDPRERIIQP